MSRLRWAGVLGCLSVLACGGGEKPPAPGPAEPLADAGAKAAEPAPPPQPTADFSGVVRGTVRLAKDALLPLQRLPEVGGKDTVIAPGCPDVGPADAKTVQQNATTGGLSPVHVALTGMSAAPPREPVTHELFIQDCRLHPFLTAAKAGDKLRLTNRSNTAFLPVLPGDNFMQAILPEVSREVPLDGVGPAVVKCGFGSYCGESVILAVAHSLFGLTDKEGKFSISGVPLDEDLTVHAWHPLFEVAEAKFKLSAAEPSAEIDLVLVPNWSVAVKPEPAAKDKKKR